jgi:hypothetical protein
MAGRPGNPPASERLKQTAIDSFNTYQSFILTPQDLCWVALVVGILAHSDEYPAESIYKILQILLREAQNVWNRIIYALQQTMIDSGTDLGRFLEWCSRRDKHHGKWCKRRWKRSKYERIIVSICEIMFPPKGLYSLQTRLRRSRIQYNSII